MVDIIGLVAIGVAAFAVTNIDDIFVNMMFFSSLSFSVRQVVLGQYLGISLLIVISAAGSLISLVVPAYVIGLMGLLLISIGIRNLVEMRKKKCHHRGVQSRTKETNHTFHFLRLPPSHFQMVATISVFMSLYLQNTIL
jgi:cadmium resistance protein CadD (predicted permease)